MNQEGIEVVVLFDDNFQPNNVNNKKSLDECIDWVIWLEYTNIIIAFANASEEFINKLHNKWSKKIKRLQIINVPNCQSANDVLRGLQNCDIIKSDFLLIHNGIALSSSSLTSEIEHFRIKRKQNKNMMATIFFEETKSTLKRKMLNGYQSTTKKLLYYNLKGQKGKMDIPKNTFLNETTFRTDLKPMGLWLCGHEFSGHFAGSDTHDFHTLEDILQNILNNEEFLCQEIYVEILPVNSMIGNALENEEETAENSEHEDEENSDGKIGDNDEDLEEIDVIYHGNNAAFLSQVLELMQDFVESNKEKDNKKGKSANEEQFEQLKLEINGLKFANNISVEEMPQLLFLAFFRIPKTDKWLSIFKELFNEWSNFWLVYFKKKNAKVGMLHAMEEFAVENDQFHRIIPNLLYWLNQEKEFIDDEQIVEWHSSLQKDSPLRAIPKLAEFIQWLKEAEEEDDDENEED